jgi:hypothetical protein
MLLRLVLSSQLALATWLNYQLCSQRLLTLFSYCQEHVTGRSIELMCKKSKPDR